MSEIKPIETEYAGCKFRSRLEARWAVFFSGLGMTWEYETEGYEMSDGTRYLPDFRLTDSPSTYVEVKGSDEMLQRDVPRIQAFANEAPARVLILGPIPEVPTPGMPHSIPMHLVAQAHNEPAMGAFINTPRPRFISFHALPGWTLEHRLLVGARATEDVETAYQRARKARFEFGERG